MHASNGKEYRFLPLISEILVKIVGHSFADVNLIAKSSGAGAHFHKRIDICCGNACNTGETEIMCLAVDAHISKRKGAFENIKSSCDLYELFKRVRALLECFQKRFDMIPVCHCMMTSD